jgi:hypothetical protein
MSYQDLVDALVPEDLLQELRAVVFRLHQPKVKAE